MCLYWLHVRGRYISTYATLNLRKPSPIFQLSPCVTHLLWKTHQECFWDVILDHKGAAPGVMGMGCDVTAAESASIDDERVQWLYTHCLIYTRTAAGMWLGNIPIHLQFVVRPILVQHCHTGCWENPTLQIINKVFIAIQRSGTRTGIFVIYFLSFYLVLFRTRLWLQTEVWKLDLTGATIDDRRYLDLSFHCWIIVPQTWTRVVSKFFAF